MNDVSKAIDSIRKRANVVSKEQYQSKKKLLDLKVKKGPVTEVK